MSIRTTIAAASLLTAIAHAQDEAVAVQGTLSLDLPSAYFFRGMQQEDQGLIVQARGSQNRKNVIRLVPPMVSTDAQIDEGMGILGDVLAKVQRA